MMDILMILTIVGCVALVFFLLHWCTEQVDSDE